MTTFFAHPTLQTPVTDWDDWTDDQKQNLVDLYRGRYNERKLTSTHAHPFDHSAEEDKIPIVVREFELQQEELQAAKPPLWFHHPLWATRIDWNKATPAVRSVVVEHYRQHPDVPVPDFISEWDAAQKRKDKARTEKILSSFEKELPELEQTRALLHDAASASLKQSRDCLKLVEALKEKTKEPMFMRRWLYESQLTNNALMREARMYFIHAMEISKRNSTVIFQAHEDFVGEMEKRHIQEKKVAQQLYNDRLANFYQRTEEMSAPFERVFESCVNERTQLQSVLRFNREQGNIPNIGVNGDTGSASLQRGKFELTDDHVDYLRSEILPLFHKACENEEKVVVFQTGKKIPLAVMRLSVYNTRTELRHARIDWLNQLFDLYNIPKPTRYDRELAWLGDASANYEEYYARERQQNNTKMGENIEKVLQHPHIQQDIEEQKRNESIQAEENTTSPPPPTPRPEEETGTTSSSSSSSKEEERKEEV